MGNLNIFVDCHVFDYGFQGTRTYIQGLYLELLKDKSKQFYFTAGNIPNLKSIFGEAENIHYLEYKSKNKYYRLLIDIPRLIRKNKIDFAHFQYAVPPIKRCKYIVSTHDVLFLDYPEYFPKLDSFIKHHLYKYSARKSEIVLTGSHFSKEKLEKHFKINNIFYQVYGVEPVFFEEYNKEQIQNQVTEKFHFKKYIIYISRHEPRKNHFLLLQSFVELELYKTFHLVLIGDVTFRDIHFDTMMLSLEKNIKDKIVLLNKVDFKDMIQLLRGAELAIYPSKAEGFGLPPLESVAAKIPTICSNTTSMAEFYFFENDFINPLDIEDIKNKMRIKIATTDVKRLNELATFVKNKYNWKASADRFNSILNTEVNKN
jgi:glycosyltransferase involved in cell wall biosynthesis